MKSILVVDDSLIDRKIVQGFLGKEAKWELKFAEHGEQALDILRDADSKLPDLIVTDLQMPEMDGLSLVQAVQNDFPLVPVILMTAQGSELIAVEALKLGAASYVPKRLLSEMLVGTVHQVLSLAAKQRTQQTLLQKMESMSCRFVLENDPQVLTALVTYLQGILEEMSALTDSERVRIGVALEEALLNAMYHGNLEVSSDLRESNYAEFYETARQRAAVAPYHSRRIFVDVTIDQGTLTFVIQDEGSGFDPSALPDPRDPANLERPSGRGVLLMRTFMDDVCYNDRGNQVTITKCCTKSTHSS